MSLRSIFENVSKHSDKWDNYFDVYCEHIGKMRESGHTIEKLVEVGVQKGGSLYMWDQYFARSPWYYNETKVVGIDIDPNCAKLKYEMSYETPSIEVVIGDQGDPKFWDDFLAKHPKIDIFIDDGGHFMDQQILTFEKVFPHLSVGGVYFCEDCHTSYMSYNGGGLRNRHSFIEYAKTYVDIIHQDWWSELDTELERKKLITKDLTSIHFYDSIVVFEKFGKRKMKRVFPKGFE
jgi:cephalosporin hydroxylase